MPKFKDLSGQKFGRLTVVQRGGRDSSGKILWVCSCECGVTKSVQGNSLTSGKTQSCGCLHREVTSRAASSRFKDITGERFGRLVATSKVGNEHWNTRCDCGNERLVVTQYLLAGHTKSCGCAREQYYAGKKQQIALGTRFGRLLVIEKDLTKNRRWLCKCDCGNLKLANGNSLLAGHTGSCGCLHKDLMSLSRGESSRNKVLGQYKTKALKRGLDWDLSNTEFYDLVAQDCHYCGASPSNRADSPASNGAFIYNGVDRVDSSLGYKVANVVPCCWACNWMKRHLSKAAFIGHIDRIFKHQHKEIVCQTGV